MLQLNLNNNTVIILVMTYETIKIIGIPGSLRRGSFNKLLLDNMFRMLPQYGEILDLSRVPVFNQDEESNAPDSVKLLKEKIRDADLIFISTPEYNHGISGVLKNAIDWISRPPSDSPFMWKTVAIMSTFTGSIGGARAQEELRRILEPLGAISVPRPEVIVTNADKKFDSNGRITDQITLKLMEELLRNSLRLATTIKNLTYEPSAILANR